MIIIINSNLGPRWIYFISRYIIIYIWHYNGDKINYNSMW